MSLSSMMMSPTFNPMRNSMRCSAATPALRSAIWRCISDCAAHRIDNTGKLDEQPVAGGLDDSSAMLGDLGIENRAPVRFQSGEGALLVRPHQPRIAGDIRRQDRGQAAFDPILRHYVLSEPPVFGLRHCPALNRAEQ